MRRNVCALLLLAGAGTSLALAQGNVPGEKWRITTTMQMPGMSMPGMSQEICKQPGDEESAPIKTEENCEIYDMKRSGNVQSFKMRCTGRNAMEGSAELIYHGSDRYQGKMQITTQGQTMVMNYDGQKIGQCDGGEINLQAKKWVAEGERQQKLAEEQQKKACREQALKAEGPAFLNMCKDPADKRAYCDAVRNKRENFYRLADVEKRYMQQAPNDTNPDHRPLTESARICGFAVAQERERHCGLAEREGDLVFIASQCPLQAEGLAAQHCAGRRYTTIAAQYRNFCATYARNQSQGQAQALGAQYDAQQEAQPEQQQPQTATDKAKGLFNKGKKALGGIFSN